MRNASSPNKVHGVNVAGVNPSCSLGSERDEDQGCMQVGVDCRELKVLNKGKTKDTDPTASGVKRSLSLNHL